MYLAFKNLNKFNFIIKTTVQTSKNFNRNFSILRQINVAPKNKKETLFMAFIRQAKSSAKTKEPVPKVKISKSEIRRLLSLAKPEKYKLGRK